MIEVRKAKFSEYNKIVEFQLNMAQETENLKLDRETVIKGVKAVFNDPSKGIYYTAIENNKIVASLLITFEWSDWRNGTYLWIQSVYVIPECRNTKVFTSMYNHIKKIVRDSKEYVGIRLYVEKNNKNAQKVYGSLGMDGNHYKVYEWLN